MHRPPVVTELLAELCEPSVGLASADLVFRRDLLRVRPREDGLQRYC